MTAAAQEVSVAPTMLLFALRDLMSDLPVRAPEIDTVETEVEQTAAVVAAIVGRARVLLDSLERATAASTEIDLEAVDPDAWQPRSTRAASIADVCFAGSYELRRAERELALARAGTERVIAIDLNLRKLRRAVRAVLETARDSGVIDVLGGVHQGLHRVADLDSGLAVRKLYAEFRAKLRAPAEHTDESVMDAMRYAAGALASLVASPDYADVRAADRTLLRGLRERVLRWARTDRAARTGLDILSDVSSSGELLRGINQRQELRVHDQQIVRALIAERDIERWTVGLEALRGLDDNVDRLALDLQGAPDRSARELVAAGLLDRLRRITGVS